ncbi:uncharacterized protein IWZ02DRAFT_359470, partial [Phyllosticta citriasiana]|uniref:uncharacterized protein n=1 Tax=Phyllosticta citriasiana TaxID=595635 RepID=UPI0030FD6A40
WLAAIRSTIRDMQIILSSGGTITYLSTSCKGLLGYDPERLIRQKITDYIHEDDLPTFASELFESQTTGKTFRFHCRVRRAQTASDDGTPSPGVVAAMPDYAIFEIQGHFEATEPSAENAVNAIFQSDGGTGGFFSVMARPYPLSQSAEIDRFLALKLEELVLNSHITQLRAEEVILEEATALSPSHLSPDVQFMENPPFLVPGMNALINPQSQQGASRSPLDHAPDSKFSGPEHHSTLESPFISPPLNTAQPGGGNGLPPGAAAAGTKGGAAAAAVSRGPKNATGASAQGKGYVCVECGTTQAPEWRRGPMGPKTLCNACG